MPKLQVAIPKDKYEALVLWKIEHNCNVRNEWDEVYNHKDAGKIYQAVGSFIVTIKNATSRIDYVCACGEMYEDVNG